MTHDYLEPLARLADDGRACIFSDQIGNGRSDQLADVPSEFWTLNHFLRELKELVRQLGIG